MIEKRIVTSEKQEVLNPETIDPSTYTFPVGAKVFLNSTQYTVRKAYQDGATHFRLLTAAGNEEVFMLSTLQNDAKLDTDFKVL